MKKVYGIFEIYPSKGGMRLKKIAEFEHKADAEMRIQNTPGLIDISYNLTILEIYK